MSKDHLQSSSRLVSHMNNKFRSEFNFLTDFSTLFLTVFLTHYCQTLWKSYWRKVKGNHPMMTNFHQLFSFQHHIFMNTCAMALILTWGIHIHLTFRKGIHMNTGYSWLLLYETLKFAKRIFWKFSMLSFFKPNIVQIYQGNLWTICQKSK